MHPYVRRFVAILEMVGGIAGLGLVFYISVRLIPHWSYAIQAGLLGIVFAISVYAGYHLWHNRRVGYRWSLFIQILQVPTFYFTTFVYSFYIGGQFGFLFSKFDIRLLAGLGSHLTLNWDGQPVVDEIGINFVALWAAYRLGRVLWPTPADVPPAVVQSSGSAQTSPSA